MRCSACAFENPSGTRFCGRCAAALVTAATCPSCGRANPPGFRFCGECASPLGPAPAPGSYTPKHLADKILTSRSALEGERKQVTVLFADVKGSMDLAAAFDPEELHRILDRFFQILADGVHRFEGTVNQYTGDGIMALFGAPIAHEDHAQRACYAALHLREELRRYADELRRVEGLSFSTRMGLNSGEVVVGKIGDDLRMDYTAQGHVVGLAQRMESLAAPDRIYLSGATARLASGLFELASLGEFNLKGVDRPQPIHELVGATSLRRRFDVARARGLTRFVGRDADLVTLESALGRAREGHGQVVGVVAEAGVGKSRLCFEFLERCRARGIAVLEGRAVSYGKNVPYLPMLELFRSWFGITDQDGERIAREKIAGRLLLLDESFRHVLPLLFEFLGVPDPERPAPRMDADTRQRQLFGVLRRLVREWASGEPSVTLIEDLHWIDASSDAFLAQWVEAIESTRGLLVVNLRPEYRAEWMARSCYHQIALAPLSAQAADELLEDLIGTDPSTRALVARIHQRTGGNPFFAEEVVQSLVESGQLSGAKGHYRLTTPIERLEVPATVQAVLAARIDRLPEREKQVLQAASVIGREFSLPVLAEVTRLTSAELGAALTHLRNAELVFEQSLYPVEEYVFKHALTREVAYGSQLRERRASGHAAAARAIESRLADKLDENAALLAHHWEAAGDALQAARWYRRAAEWVVNDVAGAKDHWLSVRRLVADPPADGEELELALAARVGVLDTSWRMNIAPEADEVFHEGVALAERAGDRAALTRLHTSYAICHSVFGDEGGRERYGREGLRLAEQLGDDELRVFAASPLAAALVWKGRFAEAIEVAARVGALDPATLSTPAAVDYFTFLIGRLALALAHSGRMADASRELKRAARALRDDSAAEFEIWLAEATAECAWLMGDGELALTHVRRAMHAAERLSLPLYHLLAARTLALSQITAGDSNAAIRTLDGVVDQAAAFPHVMSAVLVNVEACIGAGDGAKTLRAVEDVFRSRSSSGAPLFELPARIARARALLLVDGVAAADEAERELSAAQSLVGEMGAVAYAPHVLLARAELAHARGDAATRERNRAEACRLFLEMGATGRAERLSV